MYVPQVLTARVRSLTVQHLQRCLEPTSIYVCARDRSTAAAAFKPYSSAQQQQAGNSSEERLSLRKFRGIYMDMKIALDNGGRTVNCY